MMNEKTDASVESIQVPWAVAASVSNLYLSVVENGGCEILLDTFWGQHCKTKQYQKVLITFRNVAAMYYGVFRDDTERGGRVPIDWSSVFIQPANEAELQNMIASNASFWESTGHSPDPKFYRIIDSPWVDDYFGQPEHFLICGSDAYIEILAAGFEWSVPVGQAEPDRSPAGVYG